jgi:hypothetical protein
MFVLGRSFQPSIMFVGKTTAYASEELFMYPTLWYALGLAHLALGEKKVFYCKDPQCNKYCMVPR